MSKKEKLIARLRQRPSDFTWDELTSLLKSLGPSSATITLHKPHPQKILKRYAIDQILDILKQENML